MENYEGADPLSENIQKYNECVRYQIKTILCRKLSNCVSDLTISG